MSILESTYKVCKIIKATSFRAQAKEMINSWKRSESPHSMLEYLSRGVGKQFLSFLIIYQRKAFVEQSPVPINISEVPIENIKILEEGHYYLQRLNHLCLKPIISINPNLENVINPYSRHNIKLSNNIETDFQLEISLFDNLITEFHKHNAISYIMNKYDRNPGLRSVSPQEILLGIQGIRKVISESGLFKVPQEISDINRMLNPKNPLNSLMDIIYASIAIQDSLENLNQLLYQAFIEDTLLSLDNDNVIEIHKSVEHYIGESLQLMVQPMGREILSSPPELVIVDIKDNNYHKHALYKVSSKSDTILGKYGSTSNFGLRRVNDDLTCLFQKLK